MIKHQKGVALALVIWFVAGMSLLVAGIVASAQVDTKVTHQRAGGYQSYPNTLGQG